MIYRCKLLIPVLANQDLTNLWVDVEAPTPVDAVQEYHVRNADSTRSFVFGRDERLGVRDTVYFARIEVEGYGSWVSRVFGGGIYRKGGVAPPLARQHAHLADIARQLEWEYDPVELVRSTYWEGEEPDT